MAELLIEGIHYRYGHQRVLNGVALHAGPGVCAVLFGANGSGKSTLLSILATRLRLREGRYVLNGMDVSEGYDVARGQLMLLGHATHLYGHLDALENLRFFCDLRGLATTPEQLLFAVESVGLGRSSRRPVRGFSAGMRKRLALARVQLAAPSLLLLDEPYSALDAAGVAWLNDMLRVYLADGGTVVMASHDPERVAVLDHVPYRLEAGRLLALPREKGKTAC
ncbi:MAG: heme ABC exporter ATP-binding protein CcmA [Magnetococcales bacterium]|nr:heme ABC exporter ATP-binding protein CcmA [Magnetococcales bacterium]MBF0321549.1 heme ABC exporter ATP-binding protein CcmA [Magnetococcales bacterium]